MPKDNREFIYRLAQRKGVTVYDMSMNEYRFELEGDYLPVDIEQHFKNIDESRLNKLKMSRYVFFKKIDIMSRKKTDGILSQSK